MENAPKEDYLRVLYSLYESLEDKSEGIKSVDVAKMLDVSKPSATEMIKKLTSKKYLKSSPYSKIHFTKKGIKEAKRVMHNHRVIEVFLTKTLGYKIEDVHEEAHRLEHAFSEQSISFLDRFLKHPKISPKGKIIPHEKVLNK